MRIVLARIAGEGSRLLPQLRDAGIGVGDTADMDDALAMLSDYACDAMVVAAALPPCLPGLVRRVRSQDARIPVLVLGAATAASRTACLDAGADEALPADCDRAELTARLHAIVRRSRGHSSPRVTVGNLCLDVGGAAVSVAGRKLELTRKEFRMLEMLVLRAGSIVNKARLLDGLYAGEDEPEEGIIGVFLCMLRKKLREAAAEVEIQTFRGMGYVLRQQEATPALARKATARRYARVPTVFSNRPQASGPNLLRHSA